jgi:3-methyl-2-oxobutanoate hydroxymethyltransferase
MAHIGLQASRHVEQSGYRVQGRTAEQAIKLVEDAEALVKAGVFALLVETATYEVTRYLKDNLPVPVISLGSGPAADGVCIVSGDAVGYGVFPKPPTATRFVDIRPIIHKALSEYAQSSRNGLYPVEEKYNRLPPEQWQKIKKVLES